MKKSFGWPAEFFIFLCVMWLSGLTFALSPSEIAMNNLMQYAPIMTAGDVPVMIRPGVYGPSGVKGTNVATAAQLGTKLDVISGTASNLTVAGSLSVTSYVVNVSATVSGTNAAEYAGVYSYAGTDVDCGDYYTNSLTKLLYIDAVGVSAYGDYLLGDSIGQATFIFNGANWENMEAEPQDVVLTGTPNHTIMPAFLAVAGSPVLTDSSIEQSFSDSTNKVPSSAAVRGAISVVTNRSRAVYLPLPFSLNSVTANATPPGQAGGQYAAYMHNASSDATYWSVPFGATNLLLRWVFGGVGTATNYGVRLAVSFRYASGDGLSYAASTPYNNNALNATNSYTGTETQKVFTVSVPIPATVWTNDLCLPQIGVFTYGTNASSTVDYTTNNLYLLGIVAQLLPGE